MTLIFRSSILSSRKSLLNSHNFLIETYHPSTSSFLFPKSQLNYILAKRSGHFEFKTLRSPTIVCLVSLAVPQVKNYGNKFVTLRLCRRPYYFFTSPIERKEIARDFSHRDNFARLSKYALPQEYPAHLLVLITYYMAYMPTEIVINHNLNINNLHT
jgi:hypothetical protein